MGVVAAVAWSCALFACKQKEPELPPQPVRPPCNGVTQMTCLPALLPPGACPPAVQVGSPCSGLTAMSEGQLTPQGCCYSMCVGIPGQCGPGQQPGYGQPGM